MRINVAVPEAHVSAPVLDAALESVTRLNESMIQKGEVPTFDRGLHYGVKWKPEPPGAEHFDHARKVLGRKWGDCDDLAPWHAASLRHTGADPKARAVARRSGPHRWHAVVQRSDGTIDDPSKRAGMGTHQGIIGGVLPLMYAPQAVVGEVGSYIVRPQIAVRPVRGAYQARADLPWYWREHLTDKPSPTDYAMTSLHTAPTAATALTGAIDGVLELGEAAGFSIQGDMDRLSAIADVCCGIDGAELAEIYGAEEAALAREIVGSFWSALKKIASPVLSVARHALPFVPGVGPIAAKGLDVALNFATAATKGGGAGPPAPMPPQAAAARIVHPSSARAAAPARGPGPRIVSPRAPAARAAAPRAPGVCIDRETGKLIPGTAAVQSLGPGGARGYICTYF